MSGGLISWKCKWKNIINFVENKLDKTKPKKETKPLTKLLIRFSLVLANPFGVIKLLAIFLIMVKKKHGVLSLKKIWAQDK